MCTGLTSPRQCVGLIRNSRNTSGTTSSHLHAPSLPPSQLLKLPWKHLDFFDACRKNLVLVVPMKLCTVTVWRTVDRLFLTFLQNFVALPFANWRNKATESFWNIWIWKCCTRKQTLKHFLYFETFVFENVAQENKLWNISLKDYSQLASDAFGHQRETKLKFQHFQDESAWSSSESAGSSRLLLVVEMVETWVSKKRNVVVVWLLITCALIYLVLNAAVRFHTYSTWIKQHKPRRVASLQESAVISNKSLPAPHDITRRRKTEFCSSLWNLVNELELGACFFCWFQRQVLLLQRTLHNRWVKVVDPPSAGTRGSKLERERERERETETETETERQRQRRRQRQRQRQREDSPLDAPLSFAHWKSVWCKQITSQLAAIDSPPPPLVSTSNGN